MLVKNKPVVSWWKSGDPCYKIDEWRNKLTDINVFQTKQLTDEFIDVVIQEKHRIFLHVNITGMGKTMLEPNIPSVKQTFFQLKKLIDSGFPSKQILVIVNPILPNNNGLNSLKLLLRLFTEFRQLRLRFIKFRILSYASKNPKMPNNNKFTIGNVNILKRITTPKIMPYLIKEQSFMHDYYALINQYKSIISVDSGNESLIGIRELLPFGFKNEWFTPEGKREKIINYKGNNRHKPILNIISAKSPIRCANLCLLCPWAQ